MKIIESIHNPEVKHLYQLIHNADYRQNCHKVVLEGKNLIREVLSKKIKGHIYTTETNSLYDFPFTLIHPKVAKKLAVTENSEYIFAEVEMPTSSDLTSLSRILVFDAVSDPGNLGTLLRSALALSWEGIYFLPNCCDPFNPKVLRASKGALFSLNFQHGNYLQFKEFCEKKNIKPLAADLKGDLPEKNVKKEVILILGNEGQGLSEPIKKMSQAISIPISNQMESLNVSAAGAILMYLLRKNGS